MKRLYTLRLVLCLVVSHWCGAVVHFPGRCHGDVEDAGSSPAPALNPYVGESPVMTFVLPICRAFQCVSSAVRPSHTSTNKHITSSRCVCKHICILVSVCPC